MPVPGSREGRLGERTARATGRLDLARGEQLDRPVELGAGAGTHCIAAPGVGDHLVGDGESPRSGLEAAVEVVLDGRVDLFVETFDDRRQDVGAVSGARRLPFVGVDPDRPAVVRRQFGVGCFEDAHARAAGRVEDHVGPAVVEPTGDVAGTLWCVERCTAVSALGEVGGDDLDVGVDRRCAGFEAGSELLLVGGRFGADEADDAGLGRRRRGDAGEEAGLFIRPGVRRDVGDVVEVITCAVVQHVPLVRVEHRLPHRARSVRIEDHEVGVDSGQLGSERPRCERIASVHLEVEVPLGSDETLLVQLAGLAVGRIGRGDERDPRGRAGTDGGDDGDDRCGHDPSRDGTERERPSSSPATQAGLLRSARRLGGLDLLALAQRFVEELAFRAS